MMAEADREALWAHVRGQLVEKGIALDALALAAHLILLALVGPKGGWRVRASDAQAARAEILSTRLFEVLAVEARDLAGIVGAPGARR